MHLPVVPSSHTSGVGALAPQGGNQAPELPEDVVGASCPVWFHPDTGQAEEDGGGDDEEDGGTGVSQQAEARGQCGSPEPLHGEYLLGIWASCVAQHQQ